MKATITLLLVLFTSIATFGQKIDLVNAPINPIALEYKKEHFNLKGDVYGYGYRVFSKEGMLIYEYGISRGLHYLYKNGFPYADTEGKLYEFNSEGYLSKKTYTSLGVQTQTYTYNPKGLLTKVINTKGYNATYEYDDKGRLSKSNVGGNIREFSYQKSGEQLLVTVKDLSKTPAVVTKHIYKNGVEIGRNDKLFDLKYDNHGNKSGYDNAIYYSDIENRNNVISVVYTKSTYSIDPLSDCKFYINGQKADFLYKQIASIQSKDIFIYNPFTEKYYIIENAIDDTKSGQKQVFSKVFINSPYYLLNRKGSSLSLGYKGAVLANTANGMRDGALKVYNAPVYLSYDRTLNQTFYGNLDNTNTTGYYPLQPISPNDNVVYLKAGENQFTVVIEGKVNAKENPTHKLISSTDGGSIITDSNNNPLYYLPGTNSATINKLYAGRKFNPATDKIQSANNKSTTTTSGSASTNNTEGQTTETRYYNRKYTKEQVIDYVFFDYIKLKSKADGLSFTVLEEQFDFLSGIWTLKNSQGDIRIGIDYLVGDKSLTVKIKYIMVGSQTIVKNDKDEGAEKMYNAAVEGFVKDLFKYLKIENNTTPTTTAKSTSANNTSGQTTETRYFNGKYTNETALKKANDFFNLKNGEKITFTKMDKKSDYQFIGNWIIKGEAENLQSKIEYLFEDDGLKIKINEIVLNDKYGALKMDKNHKDEAARKTAENLYASINDLFVKAVFVYLGIENNTTPATSSSKTISVTNTPGHTVVKDYSKDKINASYNENTALYARKINDTTVYFYQDNQRINEPLHHVIVSVGTTRRLYCTYAKGKDYYSPIAVNDMSTEKLYPLINRKGVNYLYVSKSNSIYNYVYNGKALELDEYEFYKSTGDYSVVKVKLDNTFYTLTDSILENSNNEVYVGNSASKGVLIHQNNGTFVFVEKGFPTRSDLWKIKKENNSYFLVNDMAKRKYSISDYEKSIKWGIHTVY